MSASKSFFGLNWPADGTAPLFCNLAYDAKGNQAPVALAKASISMRVRVVIKNSHEWARKNGFCSEVALGESEIAGSSLRRGGQSWAEECGISPDSRRLHARWAKNSVASGVYVEWSQKLENQVAKQL